MIDVKKELLIGDKEVKLLHQFYVSCNILVIMTDEDKIYLFDNKGMPLEDTPARYRLSNSLELSYRYFTIYPDWKPEYNRVLEKVDAQTALLDAQRHNNGGFYADNPKKSAFAIEQELHNGIVAKTEIINA